MNTVIVGASLAGLRMVEALRAAECDDAIILIGDENYAPYDRPPLSKEILTGKLDDDDILLRGTDLSDLDVDLRLGVRAIALDPRTKTIEPHHGTRIAYDQLVIATGSRARRLGHLPELAGIEILRTIEDALAIRDAMERGPAVAVIGAGFIGSEVASAARHHGLDTTVIEALPAPMCRVFGPTLGERFGLLHADNGSHLRCHAGVVGAEGSERVERVVLEDGSTVAADLVIVGVGSAPNVEWLAGTGFDLTDGILCDARGRVVGAEAIHAVGDVARWPSARFGDAIRTEHWTAAGDQAQIVAADLLGRTAPPEPLPYVWSDQFGRRIQVGGRCRPDDELFVVRDDNEGFVAICGRGGQLTSVVAMDDPKQFGLLRRMLLRGATWDEARDGARVKSAR